MRKPRILDLACCAGGAAMGYHRAGFEVVGVDINPQPRYPFKFIQADGLEVLRDRAFVESFDAVHASWPCQGFKKGTLWSDKPDLVTPGRKLMSTFDLPWVIENVIEAPLLDPIVLCGTMFQGPTGKPLRVYRHRKFEASPGLTLVAPPHPKHTVKVANSQRLKRWNEGWNASITGDVGTYVGPEGMGIDWMTGNELSEAIPPAYTEFIGKQLLAHLALGGERAMRKPRSIITCVRCHRVRQHGGRRLCTSCYILTGPAPHGDGTRENYPCVVRPREETIEDYTFLRGQGLDEQEIAQRLGYSRVDSLQRMIRTATADGVLT